ncbi:hypothetical protein F9C07_2161554 [Aspergillus flavus]|uniref:Uncharacterized protein n=3 Tax=Aspergillus subgen. Circumdati TaxID=2720871 RepID=A0A7U2QSS8_ASPFN|nr:hypothetical protein F9C07_2161554 [Aspergillus flavus]GMF70946.1 unnamed protein product [Aspergillus oryzae]GMG48018.1 unnamed protein product [Aspergillus oryzae var. brunneus]GMF90267.1 unnamed protein product [Aspergillus oryzae]GMG05206.1 unnamed protein product [Aspergillus oryzae]
MGGNDRQNAHRVSCSDFEFTISRRLQLGVKVGDEVMLQFQLTETLNPEMYATKASIRDPASRLAVSIKGKGANGDYFVWLKNDGEKTVMIMNSLVDALEGVSLSETKAMPRRWYVTRQHGTSKKDVVYTTEDES